MSWRDLAETRTNHKLLVKSPGNANAIVGRWVVWGDESDRKRNQLGFESSYLGRSLTWPHYVQALAANGTTPGIINPLPMLADQVRRFAFDPVC